MYKLTARFEDETTLYTVEGTAEKIAQFYEIMESDSLPCTFDLTYNGKPVYNWEMREGKLVFCGDITDCEHVYVFRAYYNNNFTGYSYPIKTSNPYYIGALINGEIILNDYFKCSFQTTDYIAPTFERALKLYNEFRLP